MVKKVKITFNTNENEMPATKKLYVMRGSAGKSTAVLRYNTANSFLSIGM